MVKMLLENSHLHACVSKHCWKFGWSLICKALYCGYMVVSQLYSPFNFHLGGQKWQWRPAQWLVGIN